jgi:hypothetical protein
MTNEIREHLLKVEHAIRSVIPLLTRHDEYPGDSRTALVIAFIAQLIEHHEAVLILIRHDMVGSAFALGRPIVEGVYRGLWINVCATDAEIERFMSKDEIRVSMAGLATAIDAGYRTKDFFQKLKTRSWDFLNSYTHTGMLQLGRRFTKQETKPSYTDGQILQMTTTLTTCLLLLISGFLTKQSRVEEATRVAALIESLPARS